MGGKRWIGHARLNSHLEDEFSWTSEHPAQRDRLVACCQKGGQRIDPTGGRWRDFPPSGEGDRGLGTKLKRSTSFFLTAMPQFRSTRDRFGFSLSTFWFLRAKPIGVVRRWKISRNNGRSGVLAAEGY